MFENTNLAILRLRMTILALMSLDRHDPKFFMNASTLINELIGVVALVFVGVVVDVYVIGNQSIFNTTVGADGYAITSVAVPILQVVILVACILAPILILPKVAKGGKK